MPFYRFGDMMFLEKIASKDFETFIMDNFKRYHMFNFKNLVYLLFAVSALISGCNSLKEKNTSEKIPDGFVYLSDISPSIIQEMRYATPHNFIGKAIPGYTKAKCILTTEAAKALASVQEELIQYSMSLKVYDCYRPQEAVDAFVNWAKDLNDNKMKAEFYPNVEKSNLFRDGYIAEKSGHSRGSTADLTIVRLPAAPQSEYHPANKLKACYLPASQRFLDNSLDFGTGFDCFDLLAHTANPEITSEQKQNRLMLKSLMEKNGFKNLKEEWWHFTLKDEPFPNTYFNFKIQ